MHGKFDRSGENIKRAHLNWNWNVAVLALPTLLAIAMVALALTEPAASTWIAEAAQAEFAGFISTSEPAPTQLAKPAGIIRTVKAN
jgi:hypothetical protein